MGVRQPPVILVDADLLGPRDPPQLTERTADGRNLSVRYPPSLVAVLIVLDGDAVDATHEPVSGERV